ncbi:LacI family transcriptional regulator [Streptomyces cocklensis]|uniref:Transcriptional regulator, LacI family n=1 Tax=Actinacidiphila cocklensis TaxID=887465 RepID=A0A9W4GSW7_9ACTN|nr:LacI family DNA-binding transcriptional regulator [Actinacidiphila cocklensis]MDD1059932.1 LacI family transcriptional regulator [Actinacidiphila cocklensis]WSX72791.1 LacI family transcriptional regulator [Streptomyces sp. NBC_00899]WSX81141.1 LacI family transcriptional regulator [Streptomyces sp. NBC_00899]CAG6395887.1 Transcriptional regulator, LacI family [Actinacidiphila cocklensis]
MNIGEIARRAGVSRSTVSYALSGKRPVAAATRKRIQDVIDELGYRPNATARALKEGRTRMIGLVIPPAGNRLTHMQLDFVGSVVDAAARADLDVLLSPSGGDHDRSFERLISESRVDGVILMEIRLQDARVGRLLQARLPFVGIGHTTDDRAMCWIDVDYAGLVRHTVRHLADLGHRKVALISRSPELVAAGYGPAIRAREGFTEAVRERGVEGVEVACGDDARSGQESIEGLLRAHPDLTAVTTVNEAALPGIQRALADAGLSVPYDFSVTGVAGRLWAEDFRPPLTAADVPAHDMGVQAVSLLIERIAAPHTPPRHILLAPPVSLRSSTGAAPARPAAGPAPHPGGAGAPRA